MYNVYISKEANHPQSPFFHFRDSFAFGKWTPKDVRHEAGCIALALGFMCISSSTGQSLQSCPNAGNAVQSHLMQLNATSPKCCMQGHCSSQELWLVSMRGWIAWRRRAAPSGSSSRHVSRTSVTHIQKTIETCNCKCLRFPQVVMSLDPLASKLSWL